MLVSLHPAYEYGKRYLKGSWCTGDPVHVRFKYYVRFTVRWNPPKHQKPHWAFAWGTCGFGGKPDETVRNVRVNITAEKATLIYRKYGRGEEYGPMVWPACRWDEFFTVCRFNAAGKVPNEAVGGWLEDNAPYPYSLLPGPDPVECIRQLVKPLVLLED